MCPEYFGGFRHACLVEIFLFSLGGGFIPLILCSCKRACFLLRL